MRIVEIIRLEENFKYGTFGVLRIDKEVFCVTLEPADLENLQNRSSIPAQQYICGQYNSPIFGWTFEIKNVPGRHAILFHPGNTKENTKGCILLGEHFGKLYENRAVLNSGDTFKGFLDAIDGERQFHLTITEHY